MGGGRHRFRNLVETLLLQFADAPSRRETVYRLEPESLDRVTEHDAAWFVRTLESGLLAIEHGDFLAPRSTAKERIFWHGPRHATPRRLTIALEAIVGIGALGRLHLDHGWPAERLGLQPPAWAFDLAAYGADERPLVVGEVKSTASEVDRMCDHFERSFEDGPPRGRRNWDRKLDWLRASEVRVVWAIGPGGHDRIYRRVPGAEGRAPTLVRGGRDWLDYCSPAEGCSARIRTL